MSTFPGKPCRDGIHRPRRGAPASVDGVRRTTCRACGCALLQTITRKWILSGLLA